MMNKMIAIIFCLMAGISASNNLWAVEQQPLEELQFTVQKTVALAWLSLVDKHHYAEAWQGGSNLLKLTMPQSEWVKLMEKIRTPLGAVATREVSEIRVAKNPPGMPAGDYLILAYHSSFANKSKVQELLILVQGFDGQWRPLSYFLKAND